LLRIILGGTVRRGIVSNRPAKTASNLIFNSVLRTSGKKIQLELITERKRAVQIVWNYCIVKGSGNRMMNHICAL
jgi:hypothetical protein